MTVRSLDPHTGTAWQHQQIRLRGIATPDTNQRGPPCAGGPLFLFLEAPGGVEPLMLGSICELLARMHSICYRRHPTTRKASRRGGGS